MEEIPTTDWTVKSSLIWVSDDDTCPGTHVPAISPKTRHTNHFASRPATVSIESSTYQRAVRGRMRVNLSDQIEYASLTDVGVRRSHNQDNHVVQMAANGELWAQQGHLFLVADGMGAHAVGEKASEQAVRVIPHTYNKHFQEGPASALRKALSEANASINAFGRANREFEGTGTTSTALVLRPDGAWVGHVGDSRVYRIRDGRIDQLSYDHSLVWEYARLKKMDPADVKDIPSNVIHRCLGPEPLVQVDIEGPHPLQAGDTYLLCSDGLSGQVSDREIGAVATALPPDEACRFLVHLANLRGGPDNITVVVVQVKSVPDLKNNSAEPSLPPPQRLRRPPWPLAALISGTLLAATAIAMHTAEWRGAVAVFLLGSVAIFAGFAGLLIYARRDTVGSVAAPEPRTPRIHRSSPCNIEAPLLDKLAKTVKSLQQHARDKHWEPDWQDIENHQLGAERLLIHHDLAGAFREYCHAMLPLAEAAHQHRNKEEEFKPHWDRTA